MSELGGEYIRTLHECLKEGIDGSVQPWDDGYDKYFAESIISGGAVSIAGALSLRKSGEVSQRFEDSLAAIIAPASAALEGIAAYFGYACTTSIGVIPDKSNALGLVSSLSITSPQIRPAIAPKPRGGHGTVQSGIVNNLTIQAVDPIRELPLSTRENLYIPPLKENILSIALPHTLLAFEITGKLRKQDIACVAGLHVRAKTPNLQSDEHTAEPIRKSTPPGYIVGNVVRTATQRRTLKNTSFLDIPNLKNFLHSLKTIQEVTSGPITKEDQH